MKFELTSSIEYIFELLNEEYAAWKTHMDIIQKSGMPNRSMKAGLRVCENEMETIKRKQEYLLSIKDSYIKMEAKKDNETDSLSTPEGGGSKPS